MATEDLQARLDALRREFVAELPQRIGTVKQAWSSMSARRGGDAVDCEALYRAAHTLAGTAGTFEVSDVSEAARTLQNDLLACTGPSHAWQEADWRRIAADVDRLERLAASAGDVVRTRP